MSRWTDQGRPITCALFSNLRNDWAAALAMMCPGLEHVALSLRRLGLPESLNPLCLPEDDRVDVAIVTSYWYRSLQARHPDRIDDIMRRLERCAGVVVGLDEVDTFALGLPPKAVARFAAVMKTQGIYRDRDLYNYKVGPQFPGANWTVKAMARPERYRNSDLEKLKLSVPCFLIDLRPLRRRLREHESRLMANRAIRSMSRSERFARDLGDWTVGRTVTLAPLTMRPLQVHCLGALNHVQRLEALNKVSSFSGVQGLSSLPDEIGGTCESFSAAPASDARQELKSAAARYVLPPVSRPHYVLNMTRHRVVVSPTGYGELCFRHGEALQAGAVLVCQDLSHVDMMFPLQHGVNTMFCRPDLQDLRDMIQTVLSDSQLRRRIAKEGRRSFMSWASNWRHHLLAGIEAHVRAALEL